MLFVPGRAGLPRIFKDWHREQRGSSPGWDQHSPLRSEEEQKNRLTSSKYCYRERILKGIMKSTRILSSSFFCDRFQEIALGWRFLSISDCFSFSFLIIFNEIALGLRFYFNFANIYLAENHVKPHLLPRGFLETINGELNSVKNVDFFIPIWKKYFRWSSEDTHEWVALFKKSLTTICRAIILFLDMRKICFKWLIGYILKKMLIYFLI